MTLNFDLAAAMPTPQPSNKPLTVWFFHDGKAGHISQLKGLANSLQARLDLQAHWIDITHLRPPYLALIMGRHSRWFDDTILAAAPDIVVTAGHAGHRYLLACKRRFDSYTVVLMSPSLPYCCFDAVLAPKHDRPPERANVLPTMGALNPLRASTDPETGQITRGANTLILIGGPSRHFHWQEDIIFAQLQALFSQEQGGLNTKRLIMTSRRTPIGCTQGLRARYPEAIIIDHLQPKPTLEQALHEARCVYITPDSVSMVFEALTAGKPVTLLKLEAKARWLKPNPIAAQWQRLEAQGQLLSLSAQLSCPEQLTEAGPLAEAERAADWLLARFHSHKNDQQP